ncbi:hypothetical protein SDC9_205134 [bioreactor metagenome]|uniref:Uncharacterized protein n=1 Tax=bioreactor metagenome TaxID=1076179 RepID=A0A645J2M7_9ZZZZ
MILKLLLASYVDSYKYLNEIVNQDILSLYNESNLVNMKLTLVMFLFVEYVE